MYTIYRQAFFILAVMSAMSQAYQILYNDGWIPLSAEEVYSRSRKNLNTDDINKLYKYKPETDEYVFEDKERITSTDSAYDEAENLQHDLRSDAIKIVKPKVTLRFDQENVLEPMEPKIVQAVNELQDYVEKCNRHDCKMTKNNGKISTSTNAANDENMQDESTDTKPRKPKAIPELNLISSINNRLFVTEELPKHDYIDDFQKIYTKTEQQDDNSQLYEVTEDTFEDLGDDNKKLSGYNYIPPKSSLNYPEENNLTHQFLNILSRHNIKPEDELPNYTVSRKHKIQNCPTAIKFIPVPLRVLPQFNNFKQLSVDPLLAVLMSNYGYYFPGSYGIRGRYRNLYGHLASNNIHNNKPFGSYKIFSDTDSSN